VAYNLRFPGQYYDAETGLNQNYFRDYDPIVGRYVESDPIGLRGGVNTYAYVRNNRLSLSDRYGLLPGDCYPTENAAGADAVNDINWQSIQTNTLIPSTQGESIRTLMEPIHTVHQPLARQTLQALGR